MSVKDNYTEQLMNMQYNWLLSAYEWLRTTPVTHPKWMETKEQYNKTLQTVMDYYKVKDEKKYRLLETITKCVLGTIVPVLGLYAIQRSPNFISGLKDVSPWIQKN